MTRQEALQHFSNYAEGVLQNLENEFWESLQKEKGKLERQVLESFSKLKEALMLAEKTDTVYFQFSLLRIDCLARHYRMNLHAYNASWYLDEAPISVSFELSFLFEGLNQAWDQLLAESKKYVGKVNRYDVNQIMAEKIMACNALIAHSLRFILKEIEGNEIFKTIPKEALWFIRWGEYRDESEIIAHVNRTEREPKEWQEALKKSEDKEDHLVFSYWYDLNLKADNCSNKQLYFAGFEKCQLENMNFEKASLLGTKWINCTFKNCDFKGAQLKLADFRGSHFENVDFREADLTDTLFSDEDVPYLHLTPQQLQVIQIERRKL